MSHPRHHSVDHNPLASGVVRRRLLGRVVKLLTGVLVLKVTASIVLNYHNYLPANFDTGFLRGRQGYFGHGYHWAFYVHIVSGPVTLILGMLLLNDRFRSRFPHWHRYLGRCQAACVLLLLTPSGLWMSYYAASGVVAAAGFAVLAVVTALCLCLGWRAAVRRRFAEHRRWMWRCYALLASAVVLRLSAGIVTVLGISAEWTYPLTAWTSWLLPLGIVELIILRWRRGGSDGRQ